MKVKRLLIPFAAMLFLAGCNSSGGSSKKEKTSSATPTSQEPVPSVQPVPTYNSMPDYGSYSGTPGVAENHLTGISINPNNQTFAFVGETVTIKGSLSPSQSGIPEAERVIHYSVDKPDLGTLTQAEGTINASVECLAAGDLKVTASSFESRYTRELVIHILPNDGTVDMYQPDMSTTGKTNAEKAKFGWANTDDETKKGSSEGDAVLGDHTWHFVRSQPGEIGTYGGAFKFGKASPNNEGSMTFSTTFSKAVKSICLQISSAGGTDPDTGYNLAYGSSTLDAWFGTNEKLAREVSGVTYAAGEECHTSRYSQDENYSYHIINCEGKTGDFTFQLGESVGAIYLKAILVEYSE